MKYPLPSELNITEVTAKDAKMRRILNHYGVVVLPLGVSEEKRNEALENTPFYTTANAIFNEENQ